MRLWEGARWHMGAGRTTWQRPEPTELICLVCNPPLGAVKHQFNTKHTDNQTAHLPASLGFVVLLGHK